MKENPSNFDHVTSLVHRCKWADFEGTYLLTATFLTERTSRMPQQERTMNIFYIIGVIVVILFVAGFLGLR